MGFEPTALRLRSGRSTTELFEHFLLPFIYEYKDSLNRL